MLLIAHSSDAEPGSNDTQNDDIDVSIDVAKFYNTGNVNVRIVETTFKTTSSNQQCHRSAQYATSNPPYDAYKNNSNPDFRVNA